MPNDEKLADWKTVDALSEMEMSDAIFLTNWQPKEDAHFVVRLGYKEIEGSK